MEKRLYLTFIDNDDKTIRVPAKIRNHPIAELWYSKLKDFVQHKEGYIETRWSGFRLKRTSLPILREKLQRCVDGINRSWLNTEYGYKIEIDRIPEDYTVQIHNIMHHHFEILMGQSWNPSEWYRRVVTDRKDEQVLTFIRGLNDVSHEIEELKVSDRYPNLHTVFACYNNSKVDLPQECEDYFEMGNKAGGIYLQYCQLGKTWEQAINDEDDEIFEENITPLRYVSGEFSIGFKSDEEETSQEEYLQDLTPALLKYGKDPNDKSLRLGRLPVADLEYDSIPKLINSIEGGYDQLHSIEMDGIIKILPPYFDGY